MCDFRGFYVNFYVFILAIAALRRLPALGAVRGAARGPSLLPKGAAPSAAPGLGAPSVGAARNGGGAGGARAALRSGGGFVTPFGTRLTFHRYRPASRKRRLKSSARGSATAEERPREEPRGAPRTEGFPCPFKMGTELRSLSYRPAPLGLRPLCPLPALRSLRTPRGRRPFPP